MTVINEHIKNTFVHRETPLAETTSSAPPATELSPALTVLLDRVSQYAEVAEKCARPEDCTVKELQVLLTQLDVLAQEVSRQRLELVASIDKLNQASGINTKRLLTNLDKIDQRREIADLEAARRAVALAAQEQQQKVQESTQKAE